MMPDDVVLPCGCLIAYAIDDGVNTMTVSACRPGCASVATLMGVADEAGKPVEVREG